MKDNCVLWLSGKKPKTNEIACFSDESLYLKHAKDLYLDGVTEQPEIIFIDFVNYPNIVQDWVRNIHHRFPSTPIVVIVESSQSQLASDALSCGAVDYLLRPFSCTQLLTSVRNAEGSPHKSASA